MSLASASAKISKNFDAKNLAREKALVSSRQATKAATKAVRAIHRKEYAQAKKLLKEARSSLDKCEELLKRKYPDIYYAGFVQDAQKEYTEALVTLNLIKSESFPDPDKLGVEYSAYLNGLSEAIGELRRHILDDLREGNVELGERLLGIMNDIYYVLVTFDYPDAITPGLRRSTDVARSIMERTRGDLTSSKGQKTLHEALEKLKKGLYKSLRSKKK